MEKRLSRSLRLLCFLACASACSPRPSLDDQAHRFVRLAVALGERDPDSLDFYAGPADAVADLRRDPPPLAAIKRDAQRLAGELEARHDADAAARARVAALRADLAAIVARVDLLGGTRLRFDKESLAFFGIAPAPIDERRLDAIRSQIAERVGGRGRLVDRYAAFAARFVVPADRLPQVMAAALEACRAATRPHVALPDGERVQLEFVTDKPWSAFSRYAGGGRSVIRVNTDFQWTVDQALQLACHEGYPGHHTRSTLRTTGDGGRAPERSVQLAFSPESLHSEAAAMLAADVAFDAGERLRVERDRLFPIAALAADDAAAQIDVERLVGELQMVQAEIARRYLDGTLEFARAARELEERALVPHPDALLKYINEYRSYLTTYTEGRRRLAARLAACVGGDPSDHNRWRCFTFVSDPPLYTETTP